MAATATIQTRVDKESKEQAKIILSQLNITLSEAIAMYLKQIIFHRGIPFELKIPTSVTAQTIKKIDEGKELHKVNNADELFEELEK
jgi:DNA-damage-inducible protein J